VRAFAVHVGSCAWVIGPFGTPDSELEQSDNVSAPRAASEATPTAGRDSDTTGSGSREFGQVQTKATSSRGRSAGIWRQQPSPGRSLAALLAQDAVVRRSGVSRRRLGGRCDWSVDGVDVRGTDDEIRDHVGKPC
jgi:hypothetical protein